MLKLVEPARLTRPANAFLRGLREDCFARLSGQLTSVQLRRGDVLSRPDERVEHVWFPESCLLSVVMHAEDGDSVETAMVGTEGALLLTEACGSGVSAATCVAQVGGRAWRAPAALCRTLMCDGAFGLQAMKLVELQLAESRQSSLCQGQHAAEPRFGRWLLESMERSGGRNPMPLTQEAVAAMLGVQRTTVTALAVRLQKAGLIRYSRGVLEILDPAGLEERACECRGVGVRQRQRLELSPA